MRITRNTILQFAIWTGIWVVFFTADSHFRSGMNLYLVVTLRVLGYALFFNLAYYGLLPLYFSDRKRLFYILSVLAFVAYVGLSVFLDIQFWASRRPVRLNFLLIPASIIGMVLFGAAATFRGFSAFESKKKAEEEANRRRLEAEIALLKSQINPHFLLNTLNNLYALALTEPGKTPDALLKLSEMVGYILYECAQPRVALTRDLEFIRSYLELQQLRLPPNVSLELELPGEVPESASIEPMVLIPFIENAFKHGLSTKLPCKIRVAIRLEGKKLHLEVDNPVHTKKAKAEERPSGLGLANTRQRLAHTYAGRYDLQVHRQNGQHQVELRLNLEE